MAKQEGSITLSGRLGNKVYYYRRDKKNRKQYKARLAPENVKQTTATKRASTDFGDASHSSSLIRNALGKSTHDSTAHYRLNKLMAQALRADNRRIFTAPNLQSLKNFQFNEATSIHQLLKVTPVIEKNDQGGLNISFPGTFTNSSKALKNTTHISIKAIGLSVNFGKHSAQQVTSEAVIIKRGEKYAPIKLNINNRNITFILLEVQSFYEVNGQLHLSQNMIAHALDIMDIMPPQEQPKEVKKQYSNKAPRLWAIPPFLLSASISKPIIYNSLPEG
jgi:hypothetical protein